MNGEEFKRLRIGLGLTQKKVSELVGMTITAISNFERGKSKPHKSNMDKLQNIVSNG
jgi:transcriptional regulator with XRE-family HTH domain